MSRTSPSIEIWCHQFGLIFCGSAVHLKSLLVRPKLVLAHELVSHYDWGFSFLFTFIKSLKVAMLPQSSSRSWRQRAQLKEIHYLCNVEVCTLVAFGVASEVTSQCFQCPPLHSDHSRKDTPTLYIPVCIASVKDDLKDS